MIIYRNSRTEPLISFLSVYAQHLRIQVDHLGVYLDGRQLDTKLTPDDIGLNEKDVLHVKIDTVLILVRNDVDASPDKYTISTSTNLKYLMRKYTQRQQEKGYRSQITFTFQGKEIIDGTLAYTILMEINCVCRMYRS